MADRIIFAVSLMNGVDLYLSYLPLEDGLEHVMLLPEDPYCILLHTVLATKIYGEKPEKDRQPVDTDTRSFSFKAMSFCNPDKPPESDCTRSHPDF